ncbi:MAG: WG repeat-containing protein [Alistipes sp.]|nr:WG repeat-containing protein [Alistipes sp.]
MQIPTISQYAATVADPAGLTRTLGHFRAERDIYGELEFRSGNNASVFHIEKGGRRMMLKCYFRSRSGLQDIYRYISASGDSLFPRMDYLPQELFVFDSFGTGNYMDVLVGDWLEGATLATEIKRACRERNMERLGLLSRNFDRLAAEILSRPWAHGDLKPDNIIVSGDGVMRLVDFDALYFPGCKADGPAEVGTPGFQHPMRDFNNYDKSLDDYPLALISVSLKALAENPGLYFDHHRSDIIILNPEEVLGGNSPGYDTVRELLADGGYFAHYKLALMLRCRTVNLPGIAEIFRDIEKPVELGPGCETFLEDGLSGFREVVTGRTVIWPVFEQACEFRDGAAYVTIHGNNRLIGQGGNYLFPDLEYEDIKPMSELIAAYCRSGKWGYVKADGRIVCEPEFEAAGNMHEGAAAVMKTGRWAYMDRWGKLLTGFIFDQAYGFRNGEARVITGGKMSVIKYGDIAKGRK